MTVAAMQRERPAETRPAHEPVMVGEVIEALAPRAGHAYIDCNVGEGGHSEAILKSAQGARVLGIDLDYEALTRASERLGEWRNRTLLHHGNFSEVSEAALRHEYAPVDGVLFDLGMSSAQLDSAERGFSFTHDGRLDMRFNPDSGVSAHDIVNGWSVSQLEQAIGELGEEPRSGRVARAIVRNRPIETTAELANVVSSALNWPTRSRIHPATRTFQALRMAVNGEMENLEKGLAGAVEALAPGGRLVVISYHSIEDRAVKRFMRRNSAKCFCPTGLPECVCGQEPTLRQITRRVVRPSIAETRENPRARSAKLRAAEKI